MKKLSLATLLAALALSAQATGSQRLTIRVSPAMAFAPAVLTVRTTIEPSDDNRALSIEIDSASYRRISEIPLDGSRAPRSSVFEAKGVPPGLYEVRAHLTGPSGPLASTMQLVRVEPAAGHSR